MAKLQVMTTEDFSIIQFFTKVALFDDPLGKLTKINDDKVQFTINSHFKFTVEGDFNAKLNNGAIEKIRIFEDDKAILEVTEVNVTLKQLLTFGKIGVDKLLGGLAMDGNSIYGNSGDDTLLGIGDTHFYGGKGKDKLMDDIDQNNYFDGQGGRDTVIYQDNNTTQFGVTANLADASQNKEEAQGDTYKSIENLVGTKWDDTLIGNTKTNLLFGGEGNDSLSGGAGMDALIGGTGKDTLAGGLDGDSLDGGAGIDFASYANVSGTVGVIAYLGAPTQNRGEALGDVYKSIQGLIGSALNDTLVGDIRANTIYGGNGDDLIEGGGGRDTLWGDVNAFGASGSDTFKFTGLNKGVDKIMDFDVFDLILLDKSDFGLSGSYKLIDGETFITNSDPHATTSKATFLYDHDTFELSFDADGKGAKGPEVIALLKFDSQVYLDINDFVLG